jgi:hypothetical protein
MQHKWERPEVDIKFWFEEPEGNRYFGRLGRTQEDNIKKGFVELVSKVLDWLHQAKSKDQFQVLANAAMNRSASPVKLASQYYRSLKEFLR